MNVGQVVKLDDNKEYMVLEKINLHNINYVYLITMNKPIEMLVATESNQDGKIILEEVKDNDELDYILSQFSLNPSKNDEID